MKPVYIVDEIAEVVAKTNAAILPLLQKTELLDRAIECLNYQHGHPFEIDATLKSWSNSSYDGKKYPLIALFQDFAEQKGRTIGVNSEVNLHLIIAMRTQNTLKAAERYDYTLKPILYPIYDEFMKQISRHKLFNVQSVESIRHTKIDRLFWGSKTLEDNGVKNQFSDWIDCIEIQNLELIVKQNTNC